MSARRPHVVIVSGGAEIVSVAIAEALEAAGIDYAVISLCRRSLLQGARGCVSIAPMHAHRASPDQLRERLLNCLQNLHERAGRKLVLLATEDGGLRCLHEFASDVLKYAEFPRARALRFGGLDKAELYEHLAQTPAAKYLAKTLTVADFEQASGALAQLGDDAVFKPALKPLNMDLRSMGGAKVVTRSPDESVPKLLQRLRVAWPMATRWVAQERLIMGDAGERGIWVVRDGPHSESIEFSERWKFPRQGGTGCWVETKPGTEFAAGAEAILSAIDYVGLAELPFLQAADGNQRLLEINTRAWLQAGLAEKSGFRVVLGTVRACGGEVGSLPSRASHVAREWLNIERAALAAVSGAAGPRRIAVGTLIGTLRRHPDIAVYGSRVAGVKWRWLVRVFSRLLGFRN